MRSLSIRIAFLVAALTAAAGCSGTINDLPTTPDPVITTDTFSGTLTVNGAQTHFVFLTATGVVGILFGCFIVGHIRDQLFAAEKRLMLYAWHLREFIPQSARRATDPTVGRTYR